MCIYQTVNLSEAKLIELKGEMNKSTMSTINNVHQVSDAIQPSHPLSSPSSCLQSFPASGSFPMSQFFASGGQSIGVSASASVLPMNTIDTDFRSFFSATECSIRLKESII